MVILFSFTLFVSAFLLFWMQLMVAKMILPLLGGSPSVWNTCLFFFQTTLLLGYAYPHLTTAWWGSRRQAFIHNLLLFLPLPFLPITIAKSWIPPHDANPVSWLLPLLFFSVGLPFFVVSTSAPLLQKWFADTKHSASSDPYFLYAASNLGSMLGVLCYPILIESNFSLKYQSWLWTGSYGLLVLLTSGCAVCLWRSGLQVEGLKVGCSNQQLQLTNLHLTNLPPANIQSISIAKQAQWVLCSFLPSSLLLGVTTYLTTDLAAFPLLWAVPLAIYLLTFILTFTRKPLLPHNGLVALLPLLLPPLIILSLLKVMQPIWLLLPLHLAGFFIVACVFHGELARSRPNTQYLTIFYFWISLGGVLGGLFNAIAAPLIFPSVLEYPLIMVFCLLLLRSTSGEEVSSQKVNVFSISKSLPISIGLLVGSLLVGFQAKSWQHNLVGILVALGILIALHYAFTLHPARSGIGIALIVLLSQFYIPSMGAILDTERSFFGVNRVLDDKRGDYHILLHGTTVHGKQSLDPQRRNQPLTYFYPTSPIGQVFKSLKSDRPKITPQQYPVHIAVMGLGIGTLAAYAEPGQQWTFYEIDPAVEKIARDSRYFTFLKDSKAPFSIVLGDGRLGLTNVPNNFYDMIVMDAFSSDAIPLHLVTREAIQSYLSKLTKRGLLVVNISNRFINLEPVLGALARDLGLSTLRQVQQDISSQERAMGKSPSHWVLLARRQSDFGSLVTDSRWQPIPKALNASLWTDDFSNIFYVLRVFR